MRRVFNGFVRGVAVVTVIMVLSASAYAGPRERAPKDKMPAMIAKLMRIVRTLGDGLTVPLP
jgi:hypothetical protein